MTVAEFNKPFLSDGHWGCLLSSALTKLYWITTELKEWHETLMMGGLEAGWDRMNCCSHMSQTSLGSDSLCASLPCKTRGKCRGIHERATFCGLPIRLAGFHGVESLCNGIPSLTWQWGNILETHLSSLRRRMWKEHWVWVTGTWFEPQLCPLLVCSLKPSLHLWTFFFSPVKWG